jgi:hypothetical protein
MLWPWWNAELVRLWRKALTHDIQNTCNPINTLYTTTAVR